MQLDPQYLSNLSDHVARFWANMLPSMPDDKTLLEMRQFVDHAITSWNMGYDVRLSPTLPKPPPAVIRVLQSQAERVSQLVQLRARGFHEQLKLPLQFDKMSTFLKHRLIDVRTRDQQQIADYIRRSIEIEHREWRAVRPAYIAVFAIALAATAFFAYDAWTRGPLPFALYDLPIKPNEIYHCPLFLDFETTTPIKAYPFASWHVAARSRSAAHTGDYGLELASVGWPDDPSSQINVRWEFQRPVMQLFTLLFHARFAQVKANEGFTWWLNLPCPNATIVASGLFEKTLAGIVQHYLLIPGGGVYELLKPHPIGQKWQAFRIDIALPTGFYTRYWGYSEELIQSPVLTARAPANPSRPASLAFAFYNHQPDPGLLYLDNIYAVNYGDLLPSLPYGFVINPATQPPLDTMRYPFTETKAPTRGR